MFAAEWSKTKKKQKKNISVINCFKNTYFYVYERNVESCFHIYQIN